MRLVRKFTICFSIKSFLLLFTFYIVHFTLYIPVYAQADATPSAQVVDIGYSKIHPASAFYFLKTIRENFEFKFAQTTHVQNLRRLEFATRRLREAKTLLLVNQDLITPTLERYIAHLNSLTDKHQQNDEFAEVIADNLIIHLQALQKIYDRASNLRAKMSIRSAMNRIIQRADVPNYARLPVCHFFAKEASSSSLNQTEKVVLIERSDNCW